MRVRISDPHTLSDITTQVKGLEKPVFIYNRTPSRARALAATFGAAECVLVTSLEGLSNIAVIVSTIPPEGARCVGGLVWVGVRDGSYVCACVWVCRCVCRRHSEPDPNAQRKRFFFKIQKV